MSIAQRMLLEGKTAIVTGASKGIGLAIARGLAEQGANVVISSRKQETLDTVARELREQGDHPSIEPIAANMGKLSDVEHLLARTLERFAGIDIIVNNAATNPTFGPLVATEDWAFDKIMEVNVKGPFHLANIAYPEMKRRGSGSIINISSIGGISPEKMLGVYSVSKAALISLTKVQATEWGRDGIRANVICPGLIKTHFSQALWSDTQILDHTLKNQAIRRIGTPEEVADLAVFLASDAAAYCTGGVYTVDGGYTI